MSYNSYRGSQARFNQSRAPHHVISRKTGMHAMVALVLLIILAIFAALGVLFWSYEFGSEHNVTFKVDQVTNIATGSSGHEYDIYTGKGNVLMNADTIVHGKTDSANVQAWLSMHQGQVVTCPVYGWRVFLLSSKMDILDGCKIAPKGTPVNY